jgi:hypothetical protein
MKVMFQNHRKKKKKMNLKTPIIHHHNKLRSNSDIQLNNDNPNKWMNLIKLRKWVSRNIKMSKKSNKKVIFYYHN